MKQQYKQLVDLYIKAKDRHQPYLMEKAFAKDATLTMVINTNTIDFPSTAKGLANITDVLVKQFHKRFENVFTVCVTDSIIETADGLRCTWLVGMTDVESGALRIGYGVYRWTFSHLGISGKPCVQELEIHINRMVEVSMISTQLVLPWFAALPQTWVTKSDLGLAKPDLPIISDFWNTHWRVT